MFNDKYEIGKTIVQAVVVSVVSVLSLVGGMALLGLLIQRLENKELAENPCASVDTDEEVVEDK